jgi:hypothetical protein
LPTVQEHLVQWEHNRKFLQTIDPAYPDWIVTAALYSMLHLVEALLTADKAKARSRHQDRLQILHAEQRYEKIYESFHVLYDLSHVTRYSASPSKWVSAQQIQKEVVGGLVHPIEKSACKLLTAAKPPINVPDPAPIALKTDPVK